ncbi:MAG: lytic transglycosylase domain-containing protein [Planctomycetota bacterium]
MKPRRGKARARFTWRALLLLTITGVLLAVAAVLEGPVVVRQVWSVVGVRRVEAHAELIRDAARESGIDACLLAAVMYAESRGRVDAVSHKEALGLFQLMPSSAGDAARRLGLPPPTREELLSNAALNARLGAAHLAWLQRAEGPDVERMLVAYNAGRTKLARWMRGDASYAEWRAKNLGKSDALAYAHDVLLFREHFRARGVIDPVPQPIVPEPVSSMGNSGEAR